LIKDIDLIRKVVWAYVKTNHHFEYDDLFSEACIAYLETINDYNPVKGKRSTYIWSVISNRLNNFINIENRRKYYEHTFDFGEIAIEPMLRYYEETTTPEKEFLAKETWEEMKALMSPEAKVICDIAINQASLYLPLNKPRSCRGAITRALRQLGWSWNSIWETFREIKSLLWQKPGEEILKC